MTRDGWVALPRGAMGLSSVCDCGISWSYSLTIFEVRSLIYLFSSPKTESSQCLRYRYNVLLSENILQDLKTNHKSRAAPPFAGHTHHRGGSRISGKGVRTYKGMDLKGGAAEAGWGFKRTFYPLLFRPWCTSFYWFSLALAHSSLSPYWHAVYGSTC